MIAALVLLGESSPALAVDPPRAATAAELAALSPEARRVWWALTSVDPPEAMLAQEVNLGPPFGLPLADSQAMHRLLGATGWTDYFTEMADRGRATHRKAFTQLSAKFPHGPVEFDPFDRLEAMVREAASSGRFGQRSQKRNPMQRFF